MSTNKRITRHYGAWLGAALVFLAGLAAPPPAGASGLIGREIVKKIAADAAAGDVFGYAVAVSGDVAVVGAPGDADAGGYTGAAYLFYRNQGGADNWGQVKKLTASDAAAGDQFGTSVAVDGDFAVVGAPYGDHIAVSSGAAYLFYRNQGGADNWGQVKKLVAADGASADRFGSSVAVEGIVVAVGAPYDDDGGDASGSVYLFYRNYGGADFWGQAWKRTALDGAAGDYFGWSAAIAGDTLVVGAYGDDDNGLSSGSAYIFSRNQGGAEFWFQKAKLTASDGAATDLFSESVAVSGNVVVVGAAGDDDNGAVSGSAYVFSRDQGGAGTWGQTAKLTPSDGAAADNFGYSVAVSGDEALIGAYEDDDKGGNSGSAYVFSRAAGGVDAWGQTGKITASDGSASDRLGYSVALDGDQAILGAYRDDDVAADAGSAYVNQIRHHTYDYNDDGRDDILWRDGIGGGVYRWLMNGAAISSVGLIGVLPDLSWQIAGTGDFNADGFTDILWRHASAGTVAVWILEGGTSITPAIVAGVSDLNWQIVTVRDYDGDGKDDILWRRAGSGELFLWTMNGAAVAQADSLGTVGLTWQIEN